MSGDWDAVEAENKYLRLPRGLVVIDDFLTPEALEGIVQFCRESTVWFEARCGGRCLRASFQDGFNCPLLLQVAEELRAVLPVVIGGGRPLRELSGFKAIGDLSADSTIHSDFGSVNVNFCVAPAGNGRHAPGAMVVRNVDAPARWDFWTPHGRGGECRVDRESGTIEIADQQNRAIIFDAGLFHGVTAAHAGSGFESDRIEVEILYGHEEQPDSDRMAEYIRGAWRSFSLSRRGR